MSSPPFMKNLKTQPLLLSFLFLLGSLSFLKTSTSILKWVYINFFRPSKNPKKYGSWALVTGSTNGIGKAFAFELAKKKRKKGAIVNIGSGGAIVIPSDPLYVQKKKIWVLIEYHLYPRQ
ncbi:hypothetical protein L6452_41001 [Arctium lappa]|uniref:Uncharacterized protein n=1 Tax=Arctium lappa TaxID=4217 RepID=A0ACB8XN84_ARCLA|nr:hypothetical protein L6452_41001 [Arctium lappa]